MRIDWKNGNEKNIICFIFCLMKFGLRCAATARTITETVSGRFVPWSFRSKYKKLFGSEPEFCLIDSFLFFSHRRPGCDKLRDELYEPEKTWSILRGFVRRNFLRHQIRRL